MSVLLSRCRWSVFISCDAGHFIKKMFRRQASLSASMPFHIGAIMFTRQVEKTHRFDGAKRLHQGRQRAPNHRLSGR
jgi:hypothetical protein